MFKKLRLRLTQKELELKAIRAMLRKGDVKARFQALMQFEPLKAEIAAIKKLINQKMSLSK